MKTAIDTLDARANAARKIRRYLAEGRTIEAYRLTNRAALHRICQWVYNYAPKSSHGDRGAVKAWAAEHGLLGVLFGDDGMEG